MDGVSVSSNSTRETFRRCTPTSETLARLASLMQQVDAKQHSSGQAPHHQHTYCQECGESFLYLNDHLHHQHLKHTLPKPHRCASCGQEFSLKSSLDLHKCTQASTPCLACQGQTRLNSPCPSCMNCSVVLEKPGPLYRQPLLDTYVCAPCGRGFSQKQALLHHQQSDCIDKPIESCNDLDVSSTPGPSSRVSSVAQLSFNPVPTNMKLQLHKCPDHTAVQQRPRLTRDRDTERRPGTDDVGRVNARKLKNVFRCRSCDMVFSNAVLLHKHRRIKHSRENNTMSGPWPTIKGRRSGTYPCPQCSQVFTHHQTLTSHMKQHNTAAQTPQKELTQPKPEAVKNSLGDKRRHRRGRRRKISCSVHRSHEEPEQDAEDSEAMMEGAIEVEDEEEFEDTEEEGVEFPCRSCAEVFSTQCQLQQHEELHLSAIRRRQCSVCLEEMDPSVWSGSRRKRLYHCVPCQEGFSLLDQFLEHCQEHLRARVEEDSIVEGYTHLFGKC